MQRSRILIVCALFVAVLGAAGCADPADGKPAAVVTDAAAPAAAPPAAAPMEMGGQRYVITDTSKVEFVGSKVTGQHDGGFTAFSGEINVIGGTPENSSVELTIDTTSLWSDDERLTTHLKSADFFDVEVYPQATFESTRIEATATGYTVTGNLDLHGVTKSISFPANIEVGSEGVKAQAEFSIKRFDFNIAYAGRADDLIRDDVVIKLDLIATPASGY